MAVSHSRAQKVNARCISMLFSRLAQWCRRPACRLFHREGGDFLAQRRGVFWKRRYRDRYRYRYRPQFFICPPLIFADRTDRCRKIRVHPRQPTHAVVCAVRRWRFSRAEAQRRGVFWKPRYRDRYRYRPPILRFSAADFRGSRGSAQENPRAPASIRGNRHALVLGSSWGNIATALALPGLSLQIYALRVANLTPRPRLYFTPASNPWQVLGVSNRSRSPLQCSAFSRSVNG